MMTSLYVTKKNKTLRFISTTFLSSFTLYLLLSLTRDDRTFWMCIAEASFMGVFFTVMFMALVDRSSSMASYKLDVAFPPREGEEILKWAKVGYILDGHPLQGELTLTNQRLLFRHVREERPIRARQLKADREEIDTVTLSAMNSKYRTGITVKVKGHEHIFTVAMPDRWVADIRNVVMHGDTAN